MSKGDKLRQIRCRLLSLFVAQVRLRHFDLYQRKGMVSSKIQGFHFSESRQKLCSNERIKMDDGGRSERPF
jgi:hypothetical protein